MTLSVTDVKNIVDSKIGGVTLTPAPTTFVDGRLVSPQIPTLCSAGDAFSQMKSDAAAALGDLKDAFGNTINAASGAFNDLTTEISTAIGDAVSGVKQYVINPIEEECNAALESINSAIADLTAQMSSTSDSSIKEALQSAIDQLNSMAASVTGALNQAAQMVGEQFEQILSAMNMCQPDPVPGITQYSPSDFTQTLEQKSNIEQLGLHAMDISYAATSLVNDPSPENYANIASIQEAAGGVSTSVTTAVSSDSTNLAGAQAQNQAMGQFMQMAQGLNNDNSKQFIMQCTNPDLQSVLGKTQVALANGSKLG